MVVNNSPAISVLIFIGLSPAWCLMQLDAPAARSFPGGKAAKDGARSADMCGLGVGRLRDPL
jgi:hypothetical protein